MAHCSICHMTFGSVKSFDKHRSNEICSHPSELDLIYNETRKAWTEQIKRPIYAKGIIL
jgi:hypothetical protein